MKEFAWPGDQLTGLVTVSAQQAKELLSRYGPDVDCQFSAAPFPRQHARQARR
jgi:hypothetical protein